MARVPGCDPRWRARAGAGRRRARARRRRRVHPWRARLRRAGGARRGRRGRGGRPDRAPPNACARTGSMPASSARDRRRRPCSRRVARSPRSGPGTYIFGDRQQAFLAEQSPRRRGAARRGDGRQPRLGRRVRRRRRREDPRQGRRAVSPGTRHHRRLPGGGHRAASTTITGSSSCRPGRADRPSATWSGSHPITSVRSSTSSTSTWSPRAAGSSGAGRWMPVDATPETGTQPGSPRDPAADPAADPSAAGRSAGRSAADPCGT